MDEIIKKSEFFAIGVLKDVPSQWLILQVGGACFYINGRNAFIRQVEPRYLKENWSKKFESSESLIKLFDDQITPTDAQVIFFHQLELLVKSLVEKTSRLDPSWGFLCYIF